MRTSSPIESKENLLDLNPRSFYGGFTDSSHYYSTFTSSSELTNTNCHQTYSTTTTTTSSLAPATAHMDSLIVYHPGVDTRLYCETIFNSGDCWAGRSNFDYSHIHPEEVVISSKDLFFVKIGQDNYLYHSQDYVLRVCSRDVMDEAMWVRIDLVDMSTNYSAMSEKKMILKGKFSQRLNLSKVSYMLNSKPIIIMIDTL